MIPVHKKGQKTNVNDYRPISLLPVLSKILEKIVYNRLYSFLSQSNLFYDLQFGFRKNHSTSHAAAVMVENIIKSFEDKEYTLGVLLDLSKAFDTQRRSSRPPNPQLGGSRPTLGAQVSLKLLFGYVTIFSSADLFTTDLNCRKKLACDIISECDVILSRTI